MRSVCISTWLGGESNVLPKVYVRDMKDTSARAGLYVVIYFNARSISGMSCLEIASFAFVESADSLRPLFTHLLRILIPMTDEYYMVLLKWKTFEECEDKGNSLPVNVTFNACLKMQTNVIYHD